MFFPVLESELNFQCFEIKVCLIRQVFLKLLKAYCSEGVNESQKLLQLSENIGNLILIPKMQKKMQQKISGFLDNLA